jgi:GxxExxY protein
MNEIEDVATAIVDSSFRIHKALGPRLLESAYEVCLAYELKNRGFTVEPQVPQPVTYESITIDAGYRIDLLVDGGSSSN